MTAYAYSAVVDREVLDMLSGALGPTVSFARRAQPEDDFHGIDLYYVTSREVPIQVRMRYDRPPFAIDDDITFRTTEPRMIAEKTYAPLMAFAWLEQNRFVGGKLIDVYTMSAFLAPPLGDRPRTGNGDGTGFVTVGIDELFETKALLRVGDRHGWANVLSDSDKRLQKIVSRYERIGAES